MYLPTQIITSCFGTEILRQWHRPLLLRCMQQMWLQPKHYHVDRGQKEVSRDKPHLFNFSKFLLFCHVICISYNSDSKHTSWNLNWKDDIFQGMPVEHPLNPTFFALNGSLPDCLSSTKNNISTVLSEIKGPAIFINKGEAEGKSVCKFKAISSRW